MLAANELSLATARSLIERGELSRDELRRTCLSAIRSRDPEVRAWTCLAEDTPQETPGGLLDGIPIGVKDVYDTADLPTGYGSPVFSGHRPAEDAVAVARLRAAGAVILGKTVSTEFAYFTAGETRNPLDLARTPGGSSSGSAAAVAARMVPVALGTQTAGSTIRPAAYCGVFGYKPTYGLLPMKGVLPLAPSLDTVGIFARDIRDLAIVAHVLADGAVERRIQPALAPRFAIFPGPYRDHLSPTVAKAFMTMAERLSYNATVRQLATPPLFDKLTEAQRQILAYEAHAGFREIVEANGSRISRAFLELYEAGARVDGEALQACLALREEGLAMLDLMLDEGEILLTPAAPDEAPRIESGTGDPICNRLWTMLGTPCLSVPLFREPGRMPIGMQVIARRGEDNCLLSVAEWLSERLPSP